MKATVGKRRWRLWLGLGLMLPVALCLEPRLYYLSCWFREQGEEVPIYCFERSGIVVPLLASYRALVRDLGVDTVILVDGGTDSLMRGDEAGLGTPEEDMSSIAAVDDLEVERKYLVCLGFGVDSFHGVCHSHALEAVAELTQQGGFLGAFSLLGPLKSTNRTSLGWCGNCRR